MMSSKSLICGLLSSLPAVLGAAFGSRDSATCTNGPETRSCWSEGFDINTNWYENVPETNVTREYWFDIQNTTASPDGVEQSVMLVNGSLPGPTIIADWGDWVGKSTRMPELSSNTDDASQLTLIGSCTRQELAAGQRNVDSLARYQTRGVGLYGRCC